MFGLLDSINPFMAAAMLQPAPEQQMTERNTLERARVCGIDCHRGDAHCNNYCHDNTVPRPGTYIVELFDFGDAIRALKDGKRVARTGWNGKGMWLALSCNGTREVHAAAFWAPANKAWAEANGGKATVLPSITMKTAAGEILMGWLASQTDMLAEDWHIVD